MTRRITIASLVERVEAHSGEFYVRTKYGRQFSNWQAGKCPFPCDEQAQQAWEWLHVLIHGWFEGACSSLQPLGERPIQVETRLLVDIQPKKVLDVGCGSGSWALEIADKYTGVKVVGIDIVGGQPEPLEHLDVTWLTPGSSCDAGRGVDMEGDWSAIEDDQSYIRLGHVGYNVSDWPALLGKVYQKLEPEEGYIEIMDLHWDVRSDGARLDPAAPFPRFCSLLEQALARRRTGFNPQNITSLLENLGFDEIDHRIRRISLTPLAREAEGSGTICNLAFFLRNFHYLETIGLCLLIEECGLSEAEARALIEECENFTQDSTNSAFVSLHVWTARRPQHQCWLRAAAMQ